MFTQKFESLCSYPLKDLMRDFQSRHPLCVSTDFLVRSFARALLDEDYLAYILSNNEPFKKVGV